MKLTSQPCVPMHGASPLLHTRSVRSCVFVRASSSSSQSVSPAGPGQVHDGRLPFQQQLQQFSSPDQYAKQVLQGHQYAWGKTSLPPADAMFVADTAAARSWLTSESQLGIKTEWPPTFQALLGHTAISMTQDPVLHAKLRHIMLPFFTADAIQRLMPDIHATVAKHMARWAGQQSFLAYDAAKLVTFDVLVNHALQLKMSDEEIAKYSQVFKTWTDGFMPPAINLPFLPFGKGMRARRQLQERVLQALADPSLPADSLLAHFRKEFGPDSDVSMDNTLTVLFAGHDTTSSAINYLLWQLGNNPQVLNKLREEHQAVRATHGPQLTPKAIGAMPYTAATVKEVLRTAQIVGYVPRVTTQPLQAPGSGPQIPSGCPFIVALGQMSAADPAVSGSAQDFKPDRWLQPGNAKSLAQHQLPFGVGQHYCVGAHLANAELTAVLTELARGYNLEAEADTEWVDFPIKRPTNGLPCKLRALQPAVV